MFQDDAQPFDARLAGCRPREGADTCCARRITVRGAALVAVLTVALVRAAGWSASRAYSGMSGWTGTIDSRIASESS